MFSLLRTVGLKDVFKAETFSFCVSLLIAQLFFKWGSFALELIGFLALWFLLGSVSDRLRRAWLLRD